MTRNLGALLATFSIAGCAAADPVSTPDVATAVGLKEQAIVSQFPCSHSVSPKGARNATIQRSVCVRTADRMIFVKRDNDRYVQTAAVPFSSVKAVNLYKLGLGRQIQLETEAGVHAFSADASTMRADPPRSDAEFQALGALGLRTGQAEHYIGGPKPTTTVIPIIVGR
jgi:hypothetical protein